MSLLDLLPPKLASLWAVRLGLLATLFIYISGYSGVRNDSYFCAFVISAIIAATFAPQSYYNAVKIYVPFIFGNSVQGGIFLLTIFATAVTGLLINEELLPGFGRFLRASDVPSLWFVVGIVFLIASNIVPYGITAWNQRQRQSNVRAKKD